MPNWEKIVGEMTRQETVEALRTLLPNVHREDMIQVLAEELSDTDIEEIEDVIADMGEVQK